MAAAASFPTPHLGNSCSINPNLRLLHHPVAPYCFENPDSCHQLSFSMGLHEMRLAGTRPLIALQIREDRGQIKTVPLSTSCLS